MSEIKDIKNKKFGMLLALEFAYVKNHSAYWKCICDCGNEVTVNGADLCRGQKIGSGTRSCGCLSKIASIKRRGKSNKSVRIEYMKASKNVIYKNYRDSAKRRNIKFLLSFDEFILLSGKDCYYCGSPPNQSYKAGNYYGVYVHNGIDRKNNSDGYTIENCVPCCKTCNFAKKQMSEKEFLAWIAKVYKHIVEPVG